MSYQFHSSIIREYDIRGIFGETLTTQDAYVLGQCLAVYAGSPERAVIGFDGRDSSPELAAALTRGFQSQGLDVTHIGLGPSPMLYYSVFEHVFDVGVMITGSHNPGHYNGFKMMVGRSTLHGEGIRQLAKIAAETTFQEERAETPPHKLDVLDSYLARLLQDYPTPANLKVAWDTGNGAAGPAIEKLIGLLPGKHTHLFAEVDGTFPNHHPDPTQAENLVDLQKAVRENGCDVGIGFDGDADRIGVVDDEGGIIWGDQLMMLYARDVLKSHPGAPIIADVKSSQVFFEDVAANGGRPIMGRTGHSLIKAKMIEENAPLAGEMSGHIFFADKFYGFDDAIYAAIRLLNILAKSGQKLSDFRKSLPTLRTTPELRFECDEQRKFTIIDEISVRLSEQPDMDVCRIDGVRVNTDQGWWLIRASNTQNVLSARIEAKNDQALEDLIADCAEQLKLSGEALPPIKI